MAVEWKRVVTENLTSTASMSFVIDEDDMASNLDTKVPTQQSVKTYVDSAVSLQHTQGTDQGLDTGGANATTAAEVKGAVTNSHVAVTVSAPIALSGQALSLVNDAAAAITEIDTGALANSDTVIPTSKAVTTAIAGVSGGGSNFMEFTNLNFTASVGSKALTIALKGTDGNDPSASNIVVVPFRSATLTSGAITSVNVTSASSLVVPSGATLGFANSETGRAYLWEINNAGTAELAISRTADIFSEGNLVSTTAIGTGSDSASVMYSASARTNVACRCIGYIEIQTGATAGEWDNAPSKLQVMGPGVRRSGDIVQIRESYTNTPGSTGTVFPMDDTIPQITEGAEVLTRTITPTSMINRLQITVFVSAFDCDAQQFIGGAIFQDATADALMSGHIQIDGANKMKQFSLHHEMVAGTVSETTFRLRLGPAGNNCHWLSRAYGDQTLGNTHRMSLTVMEVMA